MDFRGDVTGSGEPKEGIRDEELGIRKSVVPSFVA